MGTSNYNLPKISGAASVKIPRDFNALADATDQMMKNEIDRRSEKKPTKRKAFITIIDDDGRREWVTNGHAQIVANHPNAKITLAINPNQLGAGSDQYLTDAQIDGFIANPQYEIINHGWNHQEPLTLTVDQLKANYEKEKQKFLQYGLNTYDYYCYPGYTPPPAEPNQVSNADLKNRLKQVYKCCLGNVNSKNNFIPFEMFEIRRDSAYIGQTTKNYIDWCIENETWCVIFGHAWMASQNATALNDILTYIDEKVAAGLIQYTTVKSMVDTHQNMFDLGNGQSNADRFVLDEQGNLDFTVRGRSINDIINDIKTLKTTVSFPAVAFSNQALTAYKENSITVEVMLYADALKLGLPDAGLVKTIRYKVPAITTTDNFHEQTYIQAVTGLMWTRYWKLQKGISTWYPWMPVGPVNVSDTTRPRFANVGTTAFNRTINKPIWAKVGGATPNKTNARSTAFNAGDVVSISGSCFLAVTAGTTAATEPTWATDTYFVDGTVTWVYISATAVWSDATGATV